MRYLLPILLAITFVGFSTETVFATNDTETNADTRVRATVKLKITYEGVGVADSDITIKHGDVALGSGRTDSDGEVSISASGLASSSIDIEGRKQTRNGHKSWSIGGWVTLDGSNYAHVKMEQVIAEMAEFMGMSETSLAAMWGLAASGENIAGESAGGGSDGGGSSSASSSGSSSSSSSTTVSAPKLKSPEELRAERLEGLKNQQILLEAQVDRLDGKILKEKEKLDRKINRGLLSDKEASMETIDIMRIEMKRDKKQIRLDEVKFQISDDRYQKKEREEIRGRKKAWKAKQSEMDEMEKKVKGGRKVLRKGGATNGQPVVADNAGGGNNSTAPSRTTAPTDDAAGAGTANAEEAKPTTAATASDVTTTLGPDETPSPQNNYGVPRNEKLENASTGDLTMQIKLLKGRVNGKQNKLEKKKAEGGLSPEDEKKMLDKIDELQFQLDQKEDLLQAKKDYEQEKRIVREEYEANPLDLKVQIKSLKGEIGRKERRLFKRVEENDITADEALEKEEKLDELRAELMRKEALLKRLKGK